MGPRVASRSNASKHVGELYTFPTNIPPVNASTEVSQVDRRNNHQNPDAEHGGASTSNLESGITNTDLLYRYSDSDKYSEKWQQVKRFCPNEYEAIWRQLEHPWNASKKRRREEPVNEVCLAPEAKRAQVGGDSPRNRLQFLILEPLPPPIGPGL